MRVTHRKTWHNLFRKHSLAVVVHRGPGPHVNLWSAAEVEEMLDPGLDQSKRQKDGSQCLQGSLQVGLSFHHSTLIIGKEKPSRDL